MAVRYTEAFKRQLKRLARQYRHIRADVEPVIQSLEAGETPGDRLQAVGHPLYKVRVTNTDARRGKSGGYRLIYYLQTADDVLLVTIYSKAFVESRYAPEQGRHGAGTGIRNELTCQALASRAACLAHPR